MSRSGYSDDCDGWALIRWRGAVASALRGKRGQAALRELIAALDALPQHRLIADELVNADGEFCALGALGHARGLDLRAIDYEDRDAVAAALGISTAMAAEIMFLNDDEWNCATNRSPANRWAFMRRWAVSQLKEPAP